MLTRNPIGVPVRTGRSTASRLKRLSTDQSRLAGAVCARVILGGGSQQHLADAFLLNRHDAGAYASLFAEDGDVVNVLGWWWQGRAEIKDKLSDAFAWVFRDSTLNIEEVHIRFLDAATAVVHVRWTLDGAKVPPGAPVPPRQGIQLQVLRKAEGRWLIASFQNTNSVPEMPFPKGPPSPPVLMNPS